jgi:hypothetical protein
MNIKKVVEYWRFVIAGTGIACLAGSLFAPHTLNAVLGAIIGTILILAGFVLRIYEPD